MSSAAVATPPGSTAVGGDEFATRGRTVIADRVVQRIAARAVAEVDNATGVARALLGLSLGKTDDTTPVRVDAEVDGDLVSLRVAMAVVWPNSVPAVTREVREHVSRRVQYLTGLRVADVDIDVTELLTNAAPPPRVR